MIYRYNKNTTSILESYVFPYQLDREISSLSNRLEDRSINFHKICIPRDNARMETNRKFYRLEDVENIPHYEIYLLTQPSNSRFLEETLVYFKFPNSKKFYTVLIHKDYTVSFNKHEHKFILRESDDLDRRIILGFCKMYAGNIGSACKNMNDAYNNTDFKWLQKEAMNYNASMQPKRIKAGCYTNRNTTYIENNIFSNLLLI